MIHVSDATWITYNLQGAASGKTTTSPVQMNEVNI